MEIVIFDTETTGLLKPINSPLDKQPKIIEFFGVKIDENFNIISEVNHLINPNEPISQEITRITGIDDSMVRGKPTFGDVSDEIFDLIDGVDLLVAHNISFDNGMLANEYERLVEARPLAVNNLCTVEETTKIKGFRLSLQRLHQMLLNKAFKAHRAKDDVFALVRVFHCLIEQGVINLELYKN